jgi:acyl-CoA synthetase (AMP-forming)/AMP-acid ligase II
LVSFVEHEGDLDTAALQDLCRTRLPPYMAPARFVVIDAWPLAATGKVDVAALEDRARDGLSMRLFESPCVD